MIVIPMAGRSQRFLDAGYDRPKHMLPLQGRSVFAHAVQSFAAEFGRADFLFVVRDAKAADFVRRECDHLGVGRRRVVTLDAQTAGQADSVAQGIDAAGVGDGIALTIFNIDTFRPGFQFPGAELMRMDGWLEVFRGAGPNWSYVRPAPTPEPRALETAEKRPISDLCCTGLYHFARAGDFRAAFSEERHTPQAAELYVAPLYNHLIRRGAAIGYRLVDAADVMFCGTPSEYAALLNGPASRS